jgi:hypothetical protein
MVRIDLHRDEMAHRYGLALFDLRYQDTKKGQSMMLYPFYLRINALTMLIR